MASPQKLGMLFDVRMASQHLPLSQRQSPRSSVNTMLLGTRWHLIE